MANWTIVIPDDALRRVVIAFGRQYGYRELIDGVPNPENMADFAKGRICTFIKEALKAAEANAAAENARQDAIAEAELVEITYV